MKLQSVALARSIWLLPVLALNPTGKSLRSIFHALIGKYQFLTHPNTPEEWAGKELKFENGFFLNPEGVDIAVSFSLYKDGFVADTRSSTDDANAFLRHCLEWLHQDYDLLHYDSLVPRRTQRYVSAVYVTCDYPIDKAIPGLQEFSNTVSKSASWNHGSGIMQPTGFTVGQDPREAKGETWEFRFERVIDAPFSDNRFYSWAACQTHTHIELLSKLEEIFPPSL